MTISQKELLQKTGAKYYQVEHLIRTGRLPVYKHGRGNERQFPLEAIEILNDWLVNKAEPVKYR